MPDHSSSAQLRAMAPVTLGTAENPDARLEDATALCLSGGGYRAMLFHVGAMWRLAEIGELAGLARVSSVSGGSITAAKIALEWEGLTEAGMDAGERRRAFGELAAAPLHELASTTIDANSILGGVFGPGDVGERVADAYRERLFGDKTLQDLPDRVRFVINATNLQSGVLWRFSKPYMGDYRVGRVLEPRLDLATAVAASSAFPPFLSPVVVDLSDMTVVLDPEDDLHLPEGERLHKPPYTERVYLTDGGVYDNLGLETAWKRCRTLYVSDGGGGFEPEPKPKRDWIQQSVRVMSVVDRQVRSLRKRQLVDALEIGVRSGAYWGIRTNTAAYAEAPPLPCPHDVTLRLANTPTRLQRMDSALQRRIVNWGYAVCDTAMRSHVVTDPERRAALAPAALPYPDEGLG